MANFFAESFPNMFVQNEVWAGRWKVIDLQTWVLCQHLIGRFATMPKSPVSKQNHWHIGIGFQDHRQVLC